MALLLHRLKGWCVLLFDLRLLRRGFWRIRRLGFLRMSWLRRRLTWRYWLAWLLGDLGFARRCVLGTFAEYQSVIALLHACADGLVYPQTRFLSVLSWHGLIAVRFVGIAQATIDRSRLFAYANPRMQIKYDWRGFLFVRITQLTTNAGPSFARSNANPNTQGYVFLRY